MSYILNGQNKVKIKPSYDVDFSVHKFDRVSKNKPCPVCGKIDWCLVASDNGAAICPRIQDGSVKRCGDAGWLHILRVDGCQGFRKRRLGVCFFAGCSDTSKTFDYWESVTRDNQRQLSKSHLAQMCSIGGVSEASFKRLRLGWDGGAYCFPMFNEHGRAIGIRRRFANGFKCSVSQSHSGLFIPANLSDDGTILVCEGPTDTAAALDLGYDSIGRANCNSLVEMTARYLRGRNVVVVSDNDTVGYDGASKLAKRLIRSCKSVKIIRPPDGVKDLREWKSKDGSCKLRLENQMHSTAPISLEVVCNH